jgi:hypothetical protein
MKEEIITRSEIFYISGIIPDIKTREPELKKVIEWADANPVVWEIVTHNKSKAFGKNSCFYIGWAQKSMEPVAILERARAFYDEVFAEDYRNYQIWSWRARFTLSHYKDKSFTGGFFQQWDEKYSRDCLTLDYTPETLEKVINKFCEWAGNSYKIKRITVNNKTAREYQDEK